MRLLLPFFFILEPLFKLSGYKPLEKQNKTKNIDLLNAHLKTKNSLLVEKYFVIFNIYSYLLYLAVLSNICDNMVKIRLSFLKIML